MPVAVDASKTLLTGIISTTWANRPSSAGNGQMYLFTDLGASGTLMRYAGSRWRPLAGQAQLASLGAAVTGIANSETIVLQTLIPAGAWQQYDSIRIWLTGTKSGTTDTFLVTVRVGTTGTTSDTPITGLSGYQMGGPSMTAHGGIYDVRLNSATSAQRLGATATVAMTYYTNLAGIAAATTITDASANALYVSVSIYSGGATNTVGITSGQIQLITP